MSRREEKTEAPTPKKKKDARKKGNIARSPEIVAWGGLLLASFVLPFVFGIAVEQVLGVLHAATVAIETPDTGSAVGVLQQGARATAIVLAPLAAAMVGWALVSNLAQTRGSVSPDRVKPKFERINPLKGLKRLFSPQGVWQAVKVLLKTGLHAAVAWGPIMSTTEHLTGAGRLSLTLSATTVAETAVHVIRMVALLGLLLGALDYFMAFRRTMRDMKMTKQEVRDEHRNQEGDQFVKGQMRQRQREMSRNRMLAAVADASVVIVNPTHVAVALQYDAAGGVPIVVAKGKGVIAERIRDAAREHTVPLVRDVNLAWSLHDSCKLGAAIPTELFEAVAQVLAFVFTVAKRSSFGGVLAVPGAR